MLNEQTRNPPLGPQVMENQLRLVKFEDKHNDEFSGLHRLVSLRFRHRLRGRGRRAEDAVQAEERKQGQVHHERPLVHLASSKRKWFFAGDWLIEGFFLSGTGISTVMVERWI